MLCDIIVIGAGPAGMTAALYALRAGRTVLLLEELIYGGQVANTPEVENYPSIKQIDGVSFAMNLYNQVSDLGAEFAFEGAERIEDEGDIKTVVTTAGNTHQAKAVIIANGAKRRKLGAKGEDTFAGRGVAYCATCDGAFYKGLDVAVVGGGNTALEDAIFLSGLCENVHLILRRDVFRGSKILGDRVLATPNITVHYNTVVEEIKGTDKVSNLVLRDVKAEELGDLAVSGIFIAVGTEPDNKRFLPLVELDETGYIVAGEDCVTATPGIYVAGDTRKKQLRQIVTATSDGAVAATAAISHMV